MRVNAFCTLTGEDRRRDIEEEMNIKGNVNDGRHAVRQRGDCRVIGSFERLGERN